ncbi:MAG: glycosyltransferase family 4 protein [Prevotellaceae bacterium]|nr:glycosyltransferase family 4 protein [Prevotellaceae bacterium]
MNPQLAKKTVKPIPANFLLYVGDRNGRKNFKTFIQAVAPLLKKGNNLYLTCTGKQAFSQEEVRWMKELEIEKKVLWFASPNDDELAYLYSKSKAFVFPSLGEGFGLPILEAWTCRTPVILSNIPCFNEIAADAGCYFDPLSVESMRETIEKVLFSKVLQNDLARKGTYRLSLFSWKNTVNQTHKIYSSLL